MGVGLLVGFVVVVGGLFVVGVRLFVVLFVLCFGWWCGVGVVVSFGLFDCFFFLSLSFLLHSCIVLLWVIW